MRAGVSFDVAASIATVSAASILGVHPFTTVDRDTYKTLVESTSLTGSQSDVETLLTGLLSVRLLTDKRFRYLRDVPLAKYQHVISFNADVYRQLRGRLATPDPVDAAYRLAVLSTELDKAINTRNAAFNQAAEQWARSGGILGGVIALVGAATSEHPAIPLAGAAVGITVALARILGTKPETDFVLASAFRRLKRTVTEERVALERAIEEPGGEPAEVANGILSTLSHRSAAKITGQLRPTAIEYVIGSGSDYLENYLATVRALNEEAYWHHLRVGMSGEPSNVSLTMEYLTNNQPVRQFEEMPGDLLSSILNHLVSVGQVADLEDIGVSRFLRTMFNNERARARASSRMNEWLEPLQAHHRRLAKARLRRVLSIRQEDVDAEPPSAQETPESRQQSAKLMEALRRSLNSVAAEKKASSGKHEGET